jgi:hypothetical protein
MAVKEVEIKTPDTHVEAFFHISQDRSSFSAGPLGKMPCSKKARHFSFKNILLDHIYSHRRRSI